MICSVCNWLQLHTVNTTTSFLATRCMQYQITAIIPDSRGTQTVKHGWKVLSDPQQEPVKYIPSK